MKIWTSNDKGDDKIIALVDQRICKGNPVDVDSAAFELEMQRGMPKGIDGFPFSYIKQINLYQGKKYIELLFGKDSTEHLRISNETKRREIFDHFKTNIPGAVFSHEKFSPLRAGKKPLIAFVVVLAIFIWTLSIAVGIESGNDYDVSGQQYRSLAGIVLAMAAWGVKNVVLVFGTLLAIAIISFIRKAKHPPVIDKITLR